MKTKKIFAVLFFLSVLLLYGTAYSMGVSLPLPFPFGTFPPEHFQRDRVQTHSSARTINQELALEYEIQRAFSTSS